MSAAPPPWCLRRHASRRGRRQTHTHLCARQLLGRALPVEAAGARGGGLAPLVRVDRGEHRGEVRVLVPAADRDPAERLLAERELPIEHDGCILVVKAILTLSL